MNANLTPWQFNSIICILYVLFAAFTMEILKTLAVWPPAGVAVAGVMIFGQRAWLGIALGTFFSVLMYFLINNLNPFSFDHLAINISTTLGNTLAALVAFWITNNRFKKHVLLTSVAGLAKTFVFAGIAIGLVSALFGVGIYYVLGLQWIDGFYLGLLNWSLSNTLAAIVIAPALYFLWQDWPHKMSVENSIQLILLILTIALICYSVFGPTYKHLSLPILQPALLLFPLLYSAIKLSPAATSCLNVVVFFSAWIGSNQRWGYFYHHHPEAAEVSMQFFFLFILSAVLLVQAVFIQRKKEQQRLTAFLEQKVEERTYELEQARQEALALSVTDPLTQLYNRRGFFKAVNEQFSQYLRYADSCALLLLDLDDFKSINDQYGHAVGDKVIEKTAAMLIQHSRESDITGRIGGEEFVVFLPRTDANNALTIAERIRKDIAQQIIATDNHKVTFTISIGVSALTTEDNDIESLLSRSDKALYQAKNSGRNQVQYC